MKIIINASGIKSTGVTQVTVSFIRECINFKENDYHIFMSQTVAVELEIADFPSNFIFYTFNSKPFFNIKGLQSWWRHIKLEKEIKPDCVFTVFGPSIWQPKNPHLMGYAYPYYVYPESPFFKTLSLKRRFQIELHKFFYRFYLQRNGKHYVCETKDVSSRLPRYIKCNPDNIYTATNTYSSSFKNFNPSNGSFIPEKKINEFRFVTLSGFQLHKNLTILNEVVPILKNKLNNINVIFLLTVDEKLLKKRITPQAREQIVNLGRIKVIDCPKAYYESDAMFLPTLMECFSANYPEAMKMGKPIITSDLPFATEVCGDAALYFDPLNAIDIADTMIELIMNKSLQKTLISKGYSRLNSFDTPESRAAKYLSICKSISQKNDSRIKFG